MCTICLASSFKFSVQSFWCKHAELWASYLHCRFSAIPHQVQVSFQALHDLFCDSCCRKRISMLQFSLSRAGLLLSCLKSNGYWCRPEGENLILLHENFLTALKCVTKICNVGLQTTISLARFLPCISVNRQFRYLNWYLDDLEYWLIFSLFSDVHNLDSCTFV